jgi:uncharacterized protein YndB with AHSA1/START domain
MSSIQRSTARAVADLADGVVLASVEVAASPERVFQALASKEIVDWWGRPGYFNTTEWTGDVRVGGRWRASGIVNGQPYTLDGEFIEVDPPRKLVHTWRRAGMPGPASMVTYLLEPLDGATRVTLRHSGFASRDACASVCLGWETSFERLAAFLARLRSPS